MARRQDQLDIAAPLRPFLGREPSPGAAALSCDFRTFQVYPEDLPRGRW
jgi:hypothetical protein